MSFWEHMKSLWQEVTSYKGACSEDGFEDRVSKKFGHGQYRRARH